MKHVKTFESYNNLNENINLADKESLISYFNGIEKATIEKSNDNILIACVNYTNSNDTTVDDIINDLKLSESIAWHSQMSNSYFVFDFTKDQSDKQSMVYVCVSSDGEYIFKRWKDGTEDGLTDEYIDNIT